MDNVFDIVIDIVSSYKDIKEDSVDINDLMFHRKQLSTYSVTMATEIGSARRSWKIAEAEYESTKNQKRIDYESKGTTKADWYARANVEDLMKDVAEKESVYWNLDYVFKAVREVLSEMNQRISYVREEEKQNKYFGGND